MSMLHALHWIAGWILLAEALNKIERTDLFQPGLRPLQRLAHLVLLATPWRWRRPVVVTSLKLLAWVCLAIGAAGAIVTPMRGMEPPSLQDTAVICGFALLIVRSRLKE